VYREPSRFERILTKLDQPAGPLSILLAIIVLVFVLWLANASFF
jgi:hypothetical protein